MKQMFGRLFSIYFLLLPFMKGSSNRNQSNSVGIKSDAYEGCGRTVHSNHLIFSWVILQRVPWH